MDEITKFHRAMPWLTRKEIEQRLVRAKYMNTPSDDLTDYEPIVEKIAGEIKPYEEGKEPMPAELAAQKNAEKEKVPHPLVRTRYYSHYNKVLKQKLPALRKELEAEGLDIRTKEFLEDKR